MQNSRLDEGFNNRPDHRVYGFRLKPFCLHYLHLLQSIDSPLLKTDAQFGIKDLFIGAEICSSPWSEEGYTLDQIFSAGFLRLKRNQLRTMTVSFKKQTNKWVDYYQDFLSIAEKWDDDGVERDEFGGVKRSRRVKGRKDLERVMNTAARVVMASGWTEEKVMMMPIGKAFAWADYFDILNGAKFEFKTEEQMRLQRENDERLKAEGKRN